MLANLLRILIVVLFSTACFAADYNSAYTGAVIDTKIGTVYIDGLNADGSTNDASIINAAIASGGSFKLPAGKICKATSQIVVSSNTILDLNGSTIAFEFGAATVGLTNAHAIDSVRTVSDAAINSGSTTLTSATANFTSADVGRSITVAGANTGDTQLCAIIVTRTSASEIEIDTTAKVSVTNKAIVIYNRDSNIRLKNGTITYAGTTGHVVSFKRIDGLIVEDLKITSSASKYALLISDATKFMVENIDFATASDGVHIDGPTKNGVVRNITGTTGDDLISITARDWDTTPFFFNDVNGDVSDIFIENVHGNTPGFIMIKLEPAPGNNISDITLRNINSIASSFIISLNDSIYGAGTIDRIFVDGLYGTSIYHNIMMTATAGKKVSFKNIFTEQSANYSVLAGNGTFESVVMDGVQLNTIVSGKLFSDWYSGTTGTYGDVSISNIYYNASGATELSNIIYIGGTTTGLSLSNIRFNTNASGNIYDLIKIAGTITQLNINGFNVVAETGSNAPTSVISLEGTITSLVANSILLKLSATGNVDWINIAGTGTLSGYMISNYIGRYSRSIIWAQNNSTIGSGMISNVNLYHPNRMLVTFSDMNVALNNIAIDTPDNEVIYTNGGAITVSGAGVNRISAWNGFARAGAEVIKVFNFDYPADVDDLTVANGSKFWNTDAAKCGGAGPTIGDGSGFKGLFSGTACP